MELGTICIIKNTYAQSKNTYFTRTFTNETHALNTLQWNLILRKEMDVENRNERKYFSLIEDKPRNGFTLIPLFDF